MESDGNMQPGVPSASRDRYVPTGDARFAFLALDDSSPIGVEDWVSIRDIEAQRGFFSGSDNADFEAGLTELVDHGWLEPNAAGDRFRITQRGRNLRSRLQAAAGSE
jgi:hypothetical protein